MNNMIVSVASVDLSSNPRCGERIKRAIFVAPPKSIQLLGWRMDGFGPNDVFGTATMKVTEGST